MTDSPSDTLRFGRIAATVAVADMARACDFYVGAIGFSKTFENGDPVGFVILKRDAGELHLTLQRDHRPAPFAVAHMLVEDIDALHAIVRAHGLRIVKGLRDKDYGLRAFVFEDPDGNRIDVGERI
ncbi:glyoxalase superfamily protein [Bosea sp. (in: a-proteobacteria)]|uniref:glyoxalase superfamily protein n=1 Tax=Bosea sp. (in: a-proteobacteria) TaxID=1871050 RepID=UPI0027349A5E|nr:glyoxalase superfamily protein [Bosea sp. (in: a-proteobacteria)]MDP3409337.1 VOC family protein [Bosea sp. (in: a-proteobacteria)]